MELIPPLINVAVCMAEERQSLISTGQAATGRNRLQKEQQEVPKAGQLINLARSRNSSRTCVIEIANKGSLIDLFDPIVSIDAGHNSGPPDPSISKGSESVLVFEKKVNRLGGTSGVVSYSYSKIGSVQMRFAVFWKVPQIGPNQYGICWTTINENDAPTEKSMEEFKTMRMEETCKKFLQKNLTDGDDMKRAKTQAAIVTLKISTDNASVKATMGDNIHAVLKVEFGDKD